MVRDTNFDQCVFINCPFDSEYEPILQAIFFCILYVGLKPRIATETIDSGSNRLDKIRTLIENSKYSIHDLSRCQAAQGGEYYRLNMPFELGMDYGCRQYFGNGREAKRILILEEKPYRYQAAISDLSGCDIQAHDGDYQKAIRKIRNWLVSEAGIKISASSIVNAYAYFQGWYYEKQLSAGFTNEDIQDYPTRELLDAMRDWIAAGQPL